MIEIYLQKTLQSAKGTFDLDVNFQIKRGSLITLYGPSGAGKTSILRMLAGLFQPQKGHIKVGEATWLDLPKGIKLPPQKRKIGLVFQDYALFPNMTIRENLEFALEKNQSKEIIEELITVMELGDLQNRKPLTLSGGQRQRTALARALVRKPDLLLLDEPLAALDQAMRKKLQDFILKIHQRYELTTILVSHDISEIFRMSDRILLIEAGKIIKDGTSSEIFTSKAVSGKFQFTGEVLNISKEEVVYIIQVLIGNKIVRVIADESEIADLVIGDQVLIASKAFNPIICKIDK